jgi:hypothetical protein
VRRARLGREIVVRVGERVGVTLLPACACACLHVLASVLYSVVLCA